LAFLLIPDAELAQAVIDGGYGAQRARDLCGARKRQLADRHLVHLHELAEARGPRDRRRFWRQIEEATRA